MQRQCLVFGKMCSMSSKQNHFRVVCQISRRQTQTRPAPQQSRFMHETHKEEEDAIPRWVKSDRSFYSVSMKSLTFHNIKSVRSTRLKSSTSQKRIKIVCKIDADSDRNFMLLRIFRIVFLRSTMVAFKCTINR